VATVTAEQLVHLAELADQAADFFSDTNPTWARTMAHAAHTARLMAERQARGERVRELRASLARIKALVG
jgi:hypothetical protein